jgi:hypothetical protein
MLLCEEPRIFPDGPVYGHRIDEHEDELVWEKSDKDLPVNHSILAAQMHIVEDDCNNEIDALDTYRQ